jgi:ribokinase
VSAARVVCVGDLMVDVCAQLPGELERGSDTPAPIALAGGGSAANTAAWLAVAGCATTFVGRVGDDALGRQAVAELQAAGVDMRVAIDTELATGTCIVLVAPGGERTMIPSAGANARGGEPLTPDDLVDAQLHLSGYALFRDRARSAALASLRTARAAARPVSVDAASAAPLRDHGPQRFLDDIGRCLLFANRDEATVLTGTADPGAAARTLGLRCGEAIVKLGVDGACWSDGHDLVRAGGHDVEVVDSTGAGDAFAAGVLAARLAGTAIDAALAAGHALAARAVVRPGARP